MPWQMIISMRNIIIVVNNRFHKLVNKHNWTLPIIQVIYNILLLGDKDFSNELSKNIEKYKESGFNSSNWSLKQAMIQSFIKDYYQPYEYRCFDFWGKSREYRSNFISDEEVLNLFRRDNQVNKLPRNKYERYRLFQDLYKRDIIDIKFDGTEDEEKKYNKFRSMHSEAICKPVKGNKGIGVRKVDLASCTIDELKSHFFGDCMLEELIIQGEELAQFHPTSINTVRFVTGLSPKGHFSFLYALFRTGCGGSVVDNVGAGGIIALINENGVIESDGMKFGQYYKTHPDTGVPYKGFHVPAWKELCAIAEKAHKTMPEQRLFGWDFAWTPNGWDLVEVNPAPAFISYQILKKEGIKNKIKNAGLI